MTSEDSTILLVDDQENVVEGYALWLDESYTTRLATGGPMALDELDDDVDVVLLDRRMPELTGDEVLEEIRAADYNCRVAMVTAVDPDFDILEMDFDAYLTKPVTKADLNDVVAELLDRKTYDERMQHLFSLVEKRSALEAELPRGDLEDNEEYAALTERIEELQSEVDEMIVGSDAPVESFGQEFDVD